MGGGGLAWADERFSMLSLWEIIFQGGAASAPAAKFPDRSPGASSTFYSDSPHCSSPSASPERATSQVTQKPRTAPPYMMQECLQKRAVSQTMAMSIGSLFR